MWKTDAVTVDVLINACVHTVENKLLQFARADSCYRFLLHAGHVVAETGNWLLQDGTLSFPSFAKVFSGGCGGSGPIDVASHAEGDWTGLAKSAKRVRLIPAEKSAASGSGAEENGFAKFASAVASRITIETTQHLLQGTDVIGVVPFSRPTVNIFQGGNGMSALFGVRGFSMLVDTGFPRRTCCWDFVRHMDRIDVLVLPQVGESNVLGARSFVERLAVGDVRTAVGQAFINAGKAPAAGKTSSSEPGSLRLSLNTSIVSVVECLQKAGILCAPCATKVPSQPINLYHKIGFGSLDMYILNPVAESKDLKDFLAGWGKTAKFNDLVSVSMLVVFRPEGRGDRPLRILFPGSSPVTKLYKGLDGLKTNPLFQTEDGAARPAAQKSAGDKGTSKPGPARPASSSTSVRDSHSSKGSTKTGAKMTTGSSGTSAVESKQASSVSGAGKTRDQKTLRDAKPDTKSDAPNQKDAAKAHPSTTSTPKKDSQKSDAAAAAKAGRVPPSNRAQAKTMPSPIAKKTQSPGRNNEASADVPAEYPVANKPDVKQNDATASDDQTDVIPQLVSCATIQDAPVASVVDPQVVTEQGDDRSALNACSSVGVSETAGTVNGDEEKVSADAVASAAADDDAAPQAGAEVDTVQSWDAPQGLPAPNDDKPKDRASATGGKRASNPPSSARPGSSAAAASSKKPAPPRSTSPPFYVDLAYVPTFAVGGCDAEFFRRVRSRHYVIPGSAADPHVLSMLADAKSAWDGDVVVIPTGSTDALIGWVMAHREELAALKIDVKPSVARSTLQLERGSSCSAYRLEF